MKTVVLVFLLISVITLGHSQEKQEDISLYKKGQSELSFGLGFPNTYHASVDLASSLLGVDEDNGSSSPLFIVGYEYGINENIGLGIYSSYFSSDNEILSSLGTVGSLLGVPLNLGNTKYNVVSFGGKLAYHRKIIPKLDTYATTYLGYNIVNDDIDINLNTGFSVEVPIIGTVDEERVLNEVIRQIEYPSFTYEVNAGGRYYFNENFGMYGEAGIGRYLVNAGFTYRMN